jgi:Tol biopolymer transport system component/tRNA A-37 threonylcarbamoyl transferase component Bud32
MGAVYKARDTRLDRIVALKVSHEQFNARFEREAKVISALNHPNICTLFDVGPNYLVMEFVEGKPLLAPERPGPLPREEAFRLALQIADALDHAHRAGVVHRDLKPANILVGKNGVKVLDFGLAKLAQTADKPASDATVTMGLTQAGMIMGTPQYMSPEQAEGEEADGRSDIFAFGAILYEMLSGKRAFDGKSAATILVSVLREQPVLDPDAAGSLEPVVRRCLAKDPDQRFQTAADLKWALEQARIERPAATAASEVAGPAAAKPSWLPWAIAALAVLLTAGGMWFWLHQPVQASAALRFSVDPPADTRFLAIYFSTALSPDGRYLVYAAQSTSENVARLWLRPMDSLTARPIPGTEGGNGVFWSPDSKSIGFVADGKLKRIDVLEGSPQTLSDAPDYEGGSWSKGNIILFSSGGALRQIATSGGSSTRVTEPDKSRKESSQAWPSWLPDGKNFLFTILSDDPNVQGVYASSIDQPKQRTRLAPGDAKAVYATPHEGSPGYLLWLRDQTLVAQAFDSGSLRTAGDPATVADNIASAGTRGRRAAYWISDTGQVAFRTGATSFSLDWLGRDGKGEELAAAGRDSRRGDPRLSPDGARVALNRDVSTGGLNGTFDIWLYEFARGVFTRFTFDAGDDTNAVWSPDGRQIAFASNREGGVSQIYRKDASGNAMEERLTDGPNPKVPTDWSRDGRFLLYEERDAKGIMSSWELPLEGDRKPVPLLQSGFSQTQPQLSPDGKWIAYTSDESGSVEVFLQTFPPSGGKWQVSTKGGREPRWRGDGKEIDYYSGNGIWAAPVQSAGGRVQIGAAERLFSAIRLTGPEYSYDVAPDGKRFLLIQPVARDNSALTVIANWQSSLKK